MIKKILLLFIFIIFFSPLLNAQKWTQLRDSSQYYFDNSDFQKARSFAESALNLCGQTEGRESKNYIDLLTFNYDVNYLTGNYQSAIIYARQDSALRQKVEGEKSINYVYSLGNLAKLYKKMSNYRDAETLYKLTAEVLKKNFGEAHDDYSSALNNLATLYVMLGRYTEAEPYMVQAMNLKKIKVGESDAGYGTLVNNLATLYIYLGKYNDAEPLLQKAVDIIAKSIGTDNGQYLSALSNLAMVNLHLNRMDRAEELGIEVVKLNKKLLGSEHPDYAVSLNNLAGVYVYSNKLEQAEPLLREAADIIKLRLGSEHPTFASSLSMLGSLYNKMGRYQEAEPSLSWALDIYIKSLGPNHPNSIDALYDLASVYSNSGNFQYANIYYGQAFSRTMLLIYSYFPFLKEDEKISFWNTQKNKLDQFYQFVLKYYETIPEVTGQMYDFCLATKGILLNTRKEQISESKEIKEVYDKWLDSKNQLVKFSMNIESAKKSGVNLDSLRKIVAGYESFISKNSFKFKKQFDTTWKTWKDIREKISENEATIEIIRFNQKTNPPSDTAIQYAALIVTKETMSNPELVLFENSNKLETDYFDKYREVVESGFKQKVNTFQIERTLKELYNYYWRDISKKIEGKKIVYFSGDGIFNKINPNIFINYENDKYLLDEIDLRMVTNTSDVFNQDLSASFPPDQVALFFANPDFDASPIAGETKSNDLSNILDENLTYNFDDLITKGIPYIKSSIKMSEELGDFLKKFGLKPVINSGEKAKEEAISEISNPHIIVFGTHLIFLKDIQKLKEYNPTSKASIIKNPLQRAFILLKGARKAFQNLQDNQKDGLLTPYEISQLNLENTALVIFPFSETNLKDSKNYESIYGLQKAFHSAGVKSIIMTLWRIDSKIITDFIKDFSNNFGIGLDRPNSFRRALQNLAKNTKNPSIWGSIIMTGN
ncbi:MAG: CHAT domain-containing protein [Candidatus Kapabacteria bacterium]|nr:CHAT domain-containing protein [Candidatus Kapabacteria bacterium]